MYNDKYQLEEIKLNGQTVDTFTYNETGAVITHNTKTFTYDDRDRMSGYSDGENTYIYKYDANGIRTQKNDKQYVIDINNNVVAETDSTGAVMEETLWGHQPLARKTNGTWYYYIYNAHGDVVGMVNDAGTVVNAYEYTPWGEIKSETETIDNPIKYAGEYYDDELDMNRYVYCRNNPIKYVDPTGYITEDEMNMYENGQMAPMAYSYLMHLTYQWYLADTAESKAVYNQWAEDFRATGYTTTNGEFPTVDEGIAYMDSKPSGWNGAIPLSMKEHYFRNSLNLNFSWYEFQKLSERLPDNMQWTVVIADLHQHHTVNGKENIKYVSSDGHFELIYNVNNELLTSYNNSDDMGTYNYYSPVTDEYNHGYYDVVPYFEYGNVR